jgi:CYTH domain-containing protein
MPDWLGPEVTGDPRFKNKNLALRPFGGWPKAEQRKVLKIMGS